jgi:hypothetical protein
VGQILGALTGAAIAKSVRWAGMHTDCSPPPRPSKPPQPPPGASLTVSLGSFHAVAGGANLVRQITLGEAVGAEAAGRHATHHIGGHRCSSHEPIQCSDRTTHIVHSPLAGSMGGSCGVLVVQARRWW